MGGTRQLLFIAGIIALLMGVLWAGQGSGVMPYPPSSPMIDQSQWIWYGALLAIAGLVLMWWAQRNR